MSTDQITKDDLGKYLAVTAVAIIAVVALLVSAGPTKAIYAGYSTTYTETAVSIETQIVTSTDAIVNTVVKSINVTATSTTTVSTTAATATVTQTSISTLTTEAFPTTIEVTGTVHSNAPLSTATYIQFIAGGITHAAGITNGGYSIALPNGVDYSVIIQYSLPVEGSSCAAGQMYLHDISNVTSDWSC